MGFALLVTTCVALAIAVLLLSIRVVRLRRTPVPEPASPGNDEPPSWQQVFAAMDEGVVVFNEALVPTLANPSARAMLALQDEGLPPRIATDELMSVVRRALADSAVVDSDLELWPARLNLRLRAIPLGNGEGVIAFMRDVTEELRTQQVRRQFVLSASHELKTPVASLQALAETIQQASREDPETAARFAQLLLAEVQRLNNLIRDLLDLSKLEDPSQLFTQEVVLSKLVGEEVESFTGPARNKGLTLDTVIEPDLSIKGDDQQIGAMIRNLLDNALKYTQEGGRVSIRLSRENEEAVLRVEDTGMGIPLQAQARVFERFFRVDEDRSRTGGGTGLGLSIVKHITELHGGRVGLVSELGEGSTFTVWLPIAGAA
jgi:two-component system phosphate regulon sensor histidine kinase PhoR